MGKQDGVPLTGIPRGTPEVAKHKVVQVLFHGKPSETGARTLRVNHFLLEVVIVVFYAPLPFQESADEPARFKAALIILDQVVKGGLPGIQNSGIEVSERFRGG
jgi:hypothetical protein